MEDKSVQMVQHPQGTAVLLAMLLGAEPDHPEFVLCGKLFEAANGPMYQA